MVMAALDSMLWHRLLLVSNPFLQPVADIAKTVNKRDAISLCRTHPDDWCRSARRQEEYFIAVGHLYLFCNK